MKTLIKRAKQEINQLKMIKKQLKRAKARHDQL